MLSISASIDASLFADGGCISALFFRGKDHTISGGDGSIGSLHGLFKVAEPGGCPRALHLVGSEAQLNLWLLGLHAQLEGPCRVSLRRISVRNHIWVLLLEGPSPLGVSAKVSKRTELGANCSCAGLFDLDELADGVVARLLVCHALVVATLLGVERRVPHVVLEVKVPVDNVCWQWCLV